ncbi:MAG: cyclic nucleotide-binding domain-containing protein [Deltaproteobacteria bacterium]|nr:cyclic nucleotide-binding domain-containing protein [Deltaproteobacteria bacterium]
MSLIPISIFQNKELFFGLSDDQLKGLAGISEQQLYSDGQLIFSEGDMGDALLIVESGSVELLKKDPSGTEVKIAALPAGAVLGEMTLVNIERRSATAKAAGQTVAVHLTNRALSEIFNRDRELFIVLLINITRILSKRLRQTNEKLMNR